MKQREYHFKKGMKPWNKGIKGKDFLKRIKDKSHIFKKASQYDEILICKNCERKFKRTNHIHYFCSINCQVKFWIKNHKKRFKKGIEQWYLEHKEQEIIRKTKFRHSHPEIIKAYSIARSIKIPKGQICVICDKELAHYKHHDDYSKPLEVIFCCSGCHTKLNNVRRLK